MPRIAVAPISSNNRLDVTGDPVVDPCGWDKAEIKRAITQGIARDGHKLKPPMAYAAYATMTAQDLDAIVAFLRTQRARWRNRRMGKDAPFARARSTGSRLGDG